MVPGIGDPVVVAQPVAVVVAAELRILAAQSHRAGVGVRRGWRVAALHRRGEAVGARVLADVGLEQLVVVLGAHHEGVAPHLAPVLAAREPFAVVARVHRHAEADLAQVVEAVAALGLGLGLRHRLHRRRSRDFKSYG